MSRTPSTCHATRTDRTFSLRPKSVYRLGWKPDTPDGRDLRFSARFVAPKSSVDLRTSGFMPTVYDQGELGSCTANAVAGAYEYLQKQSGYVDYIPSRLFIYYNERNVEGTVNYDAGAEIRDGMKVVNALGAPHEALWPYNIQAFASVPPQVAFDDGLRHQCIQYSRVNVAVADVQNALNRGFPVVFGFTVFESFMTSEVAKTGMAPIPKPTEAVEGGHAVLMVGYETVKRVLYAIVRNSWSDAWGDHGYFRMPMKWLCDPKNADDFWIVQSVEA